MKKIVLLTCIALMAPFLSKAQEKQQDLSLQKAMEYAMEYNKQLHLSQYNIDLYKQKIRESVSQGLPQVGGAVNYSTNFGYSMDFGGMLIKMKDQMNANLTVSQLIFSGQWILGVQTAKIAEQIAEQSASVTELEIKENVKNTYYMILVNERIRDILKNNLQNMEDMYVHTKNMYDAGVVEITDVDQIRISAGTLKNTLSSVERNVEVSYNLLRLQLGMKLSDTLNLTDQLENFLNIEEFAAFVIKPFEINDNAEYQLMATQEKLSEKMVGMQKWSYAPTIAGNYAYTHKIMKPSLDMSPKHSAGITMSIPLFSGFNKKSKVEQSKIELEQTRLNKSLMEDQLNMNEAQYKFELKNATENYLLQQENIGVAERVLANVQNKYKQGAVSSLDLTQANTNYLQAETDYTQACLTLLQAKTKLEKLYNAIP